MLLLAWSSTRQINRIAELASEAQTWKWVKGGWIPLFIEALESEFPLDFFCLWRCGEVCPWHVTRLCHSLISRSQAQASPFILEVRVKVRWLLTHLFDSHMFLTLLIETIWGSAQCVAAGLIGHVNKMYTHSAINNHTRFQYNELHGLYRQLMLFFFF